jgi:hypothetical protein
MLTVCRIAGAETCPGVRRSARSLKFSMVGTATAEAEVNQKVARFDPAECRQSLSECNDAGLNYPVALGAACQQSDPANLLALLRPHTERPYRSRSAEPCARFARSHQSSSQAAIWAAYRAQGWMGTGRC